MPRICTGPTDEQATVTNTNFINVLGRGGSPTDSYILDQGNGAFARAGLIRVG